MYQLPKMPYDFGALEPVISGQIMELHYTKHHQGYVTNLNTALEKYDAAQKKQDIAAMIALQQAIKFNGGGHINHSIFWTNLAPPSQGGGVPSEGALMKAIQDQFGSLEILKEKMSTHAVGVQGSGWAWLGFDKPSGRLILTTCANQDPLSTQGYIPLLGIDVWEHAYYLQYRNVRADYVKKIWDVVNWKNIEQRYQEVQS
jgi:Fe-Mn family superoxide dismutase